MARYTMELRQIMSDPHMRPLLEQALNSYPMYKPFSENDEVRAIIPTRDVLNEKLLNHYKYREIAFETVPRFLDELEITMNEIMPYYNQMFNSVEIMALIDDPFGNVDVTETFKETRKGSSKANDTASNKTSAEDESNTSSSVNSTSKNLDTENPQGNIAKSASEIDDVTHADKASWNKNTSNDTGISKGKSSTDSNSTSSSNSESAGEVEHTFTKKGNQGVNTYAHDMIEFRTSIIDVVTMILDDKRVKELFLQVF